MLDAWYLSRATRNMNVDLGTLIWGSTLVYKCTRVALISALYVVAYMIYIFAIIIINFIEATTCKWTWTSVMEIYYILLYVYCMKSKVKIVFLGCEIVWILKVLNIVKMLLMLHPECNQIDNIYIYLNHKYLYIWSQFHHQS